MKGSIWRWVFSLDNVQCIFRWLGFKPHGQKGKRVHLFTAFLLLWLIDVFLGLLHEWNNFITRLSILSDVTMLISLIVYLNLLGDIHILFGVIRRYKTNLHENRSFENINRRFLEKLKKIKEYMIMGFKLMLVFHLIFFGMPISTVVYNVMKYEGEFDYRVMPQIWYFHYPANIAHVTLLHYCFVTIYTYLCMLLATCFAYVLVYTVTFSMYCLISSFDYVMLCMLDWERLSTEITAKIAQNCPTSKQKTYELQLRYGLYEIIVFHQNICSESTIINKGIRRIALVFVNSCAIQMCLSIFSLTEADDKLKCLTVGMLIFTILICICGSGQLIKNKVDILRIAMSEFEWVDKPAFYKKSLLIMITHAGRDLEINPYGLCSWDMQTFSKIMKLIYSISNLVSHYKAKV